MMLPPVMLPVAEINPGVVMFEPAISPVTFKLLTTWKALGILPMSAALQCMEVVTEIRLPLKKRP